MTAPLEPNLNPTLPPYMPRAEAALLIWIEQFLNALKPLLGLFEIDPDEYDDLLARFAIVKDAYACHIHSEGLARANTGYKNLALYDRNHLQASSPREEAANVSGCCRL